MMYPDELQSCIVKNSSVPNEGDSSFIINHFTTDEDHGVLRLMAISTTPLENVMKDDVI